jgi:hypothetical protein
MKNAIILSLITSCFVSIAHPGVNRKWHPVNDVDENGNTHLHRLALECGKFNDIHEIYSELFNLKLIYSAIPNPDIENNDGETAEDIAGSQACDNYRLMTTALRMLRIGYYQGEFDNGHNFLSQDRIKTLREKAISDIEQQKEILARVEEWKQNIQNQNQ